MAISVRDRFTQATLPITSGIIETTNADMDQILSNRQLRNLIACLGVGVCFPRDTITSRTFDLNLLRYGEIIFVMDHDQKGNYICDQVLKFLLRFMFPLVKHVPLYACVCEYPSRLSEAEFEQMIMVGSTRKIVLLDVRADSHATSPVNLASEVLP